MPYATHTTVEAPMAMYTVIHRHVLATTQGKVDGLLVHLARPTSTGFEVFEVWETREQCDSVTRNVLGPAFAAAAAEAGMAGPLPQPLIEESALCGLVIPSAGIAT